MDQSRIYSGFECSLKGYWKHILFNILILRLLILSFYLNKIIIVIVVLEYKEQLAHEIMDRYSKGLIVVPSQSFSVATYCLVDVNIQIGKICTVFLF